MTDLFYRQPEFVLEDLAHDYETPAGVNIHNQQNLYTRYRNWIDPVDLVGKSVLDIGSKISSAGAYCLSNGARRYVGVEKDIDLINIAKKNLKKYYKDSNVSLICECAENFVDNYQENFDIVLVGRTLHQITNGVNFIKKLGNIANAIVIEDVHPPNIIVNELIKQIDKPQSVSNILYELEYNYPVIETNSLDLINYLKDYPFGKSELVFKGKETGTAYSIGYLKLILRPLGFIEDLSSYNNMKMCFPGEYGFGLYDTGDGIKNYIVKFLKNV